MGAITMNEQDIKCIEEAAAHLGAALMQSIPADDQIIMGHVRDAHELLEKAQKTWPMMDILETIKFYANPEVYKPHPHGIAFDRRDLSYGARALLSRMGGGE